MEVAELIGLTEWIDREIKTTDIAGRYQRLHQILAQNAQANQQMQPFEKQQKDLIDGISRVRLQDLTTQQVDFLSFLGILEWVGPEAVTAVEDVLFRHALDVASAAAKMQTALKAVQEGTQRSNQIQSSLSGWLPPTSKLDNEVLIRVGFSSKASISNLVDLKTWSSKWHDIGRGIAMANGSSPEAIRVVGASRGSIVVDLAVTYGIARTVTAIMLEALKVAERVLSIKQKAEEIRGLELSNDQLAAQIEEEAKREKEEGAKGIAGKAAALAGVAGRGKGERITALEKSVAGLLDFLDKGGEVDCVMPQEPEEIEEGDTDESGPEDGLTEDLRALRSASREIRLLERKLRLLGPGSIEENG